jgi:hypothetical protein
VQDDSVGHCGGHFEARAGVRTLLKKQEVIDAAVDGTARSDPCRDNLFEGPYAEALLAAAAEARSDETREVAELGLAMGTGALGSEPTSQARPGRRRSSRGRT